MRTISVFLTFFLFSFSCIKSSDCEEPKLDCAAINCFAFWSYFDFKLVDKQTGEDLLSGSNPRYTLADIKLYADAARTNILGITRDEIKKSIQTMNAREEMYLEIKGTDVYKLTASFIANDCCSNRVKSLTIEGQLFCSCCNDVTALPVN